MTTRTASRWWPILRRGPASYTPPGAGPDTTVGLGPGTTAGLGAGTGAEVGWDAGGQPDVDEAEWVGPGSGPAGWLPELVRVTPRQVGVGRDWAATLAVVGYPSEALPGWLEPLLAYGSARVEVGVHIDPVPPEIAQRQLRRQLARLESARWHDADTGRLADPHTDAAAQDAHDLAARLARADTRLHRLGIYLTVHAPDPGELDEHLAALRALCSAALCDARPVTYRALPGWVSTRPFGIDGLAQRRVMDTDAVATTFPFATADLPVDPISGAAGEGVLYGRNLASGGLVLHDRFNPVTSPNHNAVVLAASGAGKSYLTKLETLRSLYRGIQVVCIDPEDEYARLAAAVGGTHIRLGAPQVRINPLDLPHTDTASPGGVDPPGSAGSAGWDVLTRRALFAHTVLGVLLGAPLTPTERVAADQAIHTAYRRAGIHHDPATWTRPAPLLGDLAAALAEMGDPVAVELAARLAPYVTGSFAGLFAGPTTYPDTQDAHLVVFSLKDLPDPLRGIGTLLALDATWRTVTHPTTRRRRLVVVDEAWLLLAHHSGAEFLARLAKSARKHWCGLTLVTQDAADVLSTDLGRAIVSNAALHILLRTATAAAEAITAEFGLTPAQRAYLTSADTGQGLLLTHTGHHIPFTATASPAEDTLITTDPAQLAALDPPPDPVHHHDGAEPPARWPALAAGSPSWACGGPDPL